MTDLSQVRNDVVDLQEKATVGLAKLQQLSDALGAFIQADQAVQANTDPGKTAGLTTARDSAGQTANGLFTPNSPVSPPAPLSGASANASKSERDQFLNELGLFVTSVSTMVTTFNTLQTSLMAVTNSGPATLTAILRAGKLTEKAKVTRVHPFTGGHLLYTGGAIVNYTVFDVTGKVTASGGVAGDTARKRARF